MFTARTSLADNPSENDGIIKLWASPNLLDSEWKVEGEFGEDLYYYFIIPPGFYYDGGFRFNFPFNIVHRQLDVYHDGIQKTEIIYNFEKANNKTVTLNTHKGTKLPYLIVPDVGAPNYYPEKRYFIPLVEGV